MPIIAQKTRHSPTGEQSNISLPPLEMRSSDDKRGGITEQQVQDLQRWMSGIVNQMSGEIQKLNQRVQQLETRSK